MSSTKRAALYVRVSTDAQTVENQIRELRQVAKRRGWDVVQVYSDAGISGAKGRNGRPGLDTMLKDASRRKFDVVMAWATLSVHTPPHSGTASPHGPRRSGNWLDPQVATAYAAPSGTRPAAG